MNTTVEWVITALIVAVLIFIFTVVFPFMPIRLLP